VTSGSLLVAGTMSDAGKSVLTAGICRWLARQGVRVAPFKAQNMSNNSVVAPDGAEIGRAQATQAAACGVPAEAAMNPVLLKPGSDLISQVVLLGHAAGDTGADEYWGVGAGRERLLATVLDAYDDLRSRFDVVVLKAPARQQRSTCGAATWSTWASHGPATCRSSWWATLTAAASSPPCTGRWRCWSQPTRR